MYISRKKFTTYEEIRLEGKFNMFDVNNVVVRSHIISENSLTWKEVIFIMINYEKLCQRFGYVRVQSTTVNITKPAPGTPAVPIEAKRAVRSIVSCPPKPREIP